MVAGFEPASKELALSGLKHATNTREKSNQ